MDPTLFSLEDYPDLNAQRLIREAIADTSDRVFEFTRGKFSYIVHKENEMLLELHTQYDTGSPEDDRPPVGPWGYVALVHDGTGSLDQTILRAYYVIPPGDGLSEHTPVLIESGFDNLNDALDKLESTLIDTSEDPAHDDTYSFNIRFMHSNGSRGIEHAPPVG